jgi:hypothetical protein
VDLIAFNYNIIDLNILKEKNSIKTSWVKLFKVGDLTKEIIINLFLLSKDNNSQSFKNINSWYIVNWPKGVAFQDGL